MAVDSNLERLQARHHEMVELYLGGMRPVDIAKHLGMHAKSVSRILYSPLFQDELARRTRERELATDEGAAIGLARAREKLASAAESAVDRLVGLLESESESIGLRSAGTILDRVFRKEDLSDAGKVVVNEVNLALLQVALHESAPVAAEPETVDGSVVDNAEPPADVDC